MKVDRTDPSVLSAALGEPRPAHVAEIEANISALWREMAGGAEDGQAVTRACSLTLLVYVESEEASVEVNNLISGVTIQNPCRVLIMAAMPDARPSGLTASISAHCHVPTGAGKQVCCEQVTLVARGEAIADLDNVVLPLMVPSLPAVVWWRASHFDPPDYFRNILRNADRILVDSARFPKFETDFPQLASQIERHRGQVTIGDLNWGRMTPWRELIAQTFDSAENRTYLDRIKHIRIEFERSSVRFTAQAVQALFLTGWLATRLRWTVAGRMNSGGQGRSFFFSSESGPVEVEWVPRDFGGNGAGVCFTVVMRADGDRPATFRFARGQDGRTAVTQWEMGGLAPVKSAARLEVLGEVQLVNDELRFRTRDPIYESALEIVGRLCGTLSSSYNELP